MTKLLIVITLIIALAAAYCSSVTHNIKVGSPVGKFAYEPQTINADLQDIVIWEWVSPQHSVIQSDAPNNCVKSISTTAFASPSQEVGKTFQITISQPYGKLYYFSDVGTDCKQGMVGTIVIGAGKLPADDTPTAAPNSTKTSVPAVETSSSPSSASVTPTPDSKKSVGYKLDGNLVMVVTMAAIGVIVASPSQEVGKTFQITISQPYGKLYYFSDVGTDCKQGMVGTIVIGAGKLPADDTPTAAPNSTKTSVPAVETSSSPSSASVTPTPDSKKSVGYKLDGNLVMVVTMAAIGVIGLLL
ncbi:12395_t:CDS:2 [Entrophospora sp. SA101]|nr:12395_t:CDS:2 [Entrophospora sp. SA101]